MLRMYGAEKFFTLIPIPIVCILHSAFVHIDRGKKQKEKRMIWDNEMEEIGETLFPA